MLKNNSKKKKEQNSNISILSNDIICQLSEIQKKLKTSDSYQIDIKKETSCVRCSGSAGRYVYEKKD